MTITYNSIYPGSLQRFSSLSGSLEYLTHEEEASNPDATQPNLGRLAQIQVAFSFIRENMITTIIGLGPGETLGSHFKAAEGRWFDSVLGVASHNQLCLFLLELGIPGLLLSLWMMVWLVYGLAGLYRRTHVLEDKEISCGLFAAAISLLICILYTQVLFVTDSSAYLFWVSAAYVSLSLNETKIQKKSQNESI
jgi:O-antigen ligase